MLDWRPPLHHIPFSSQEAPQSATGPGQDPVQNHNSKADGFGWDVWAILSSSNLGIDKVAPLARVKLDVN